MRIIITGRNLELTESIKSAVEKKIGRLEKFFYPDTECHVTLSVQKSLQKAEVTIPIKGHVIRSEQASEDLYITLDMVADMIEKQLKKYRTRLADKKSAASFRPEFLEREEESDDEIRIVRTKQIDMKPMFPEDACLEMELIGHDFFVFRNAETDQINVVYKRKGNSYGLIEPEI